MPSCCPCGKFFVSVLLTAALSAGIALAQTATGEINGTVTDASGGVVSNAAVTLTNIQTNIIDRAQTNGNGQFVFINVQPGTYTLGFEAQGFKIARVPPFQVAVNQVMTQNMVLSVGSVNEEVNVTAAAPLLQQSSTELGTVISETAVKDLPLNGRNFTQLMILTPGANPISTAQGSGGVGFQDAGITGIPNTAFYKPSLHGQQNRSVLYYLDGIINTDFRGSIYGFLPIIDTVQEFKVQSHDPNAEFGGVVGGVVNLVSKSGTNQFHGSAWEFLRNNDFDASNPFTGLPGAYRQNEFGAAAGGPIFKNKTFFYAGYEGWRYTKASTSQTLIPTDAELNGDFSSSVNGQNIYDPRSTVCASGSCTRQQFPNNQIPLSQISQPMQTLLKGYFATPNFSLGQNNYLETRPQTDDMNGWQVRIDHYMNERNTFFGRLSQMWVQDIQPVNGTNEETPSNYHAYDFGGGYDHIFTPHLMLDVRAGAMLKPYVFNQADSSAGMKPATSAGFQNVDQYGGMTVVLASPYTTSSIGQRGDSYRGNPGVNWDANVSWMKGSHNIKMGAQFIYVNRYQNNLYQQYNFSDATTSNMGAAHTGNSLASALLGLPSSYTGELPQYASVYFRFTVWSGYLQDEWKVSPRLTVDLGLRYDDLPAAVPLNSRLSNSFDLKNQEWLIGASSVPACTTPFSDPCVPGGLANVPYSDHIQLAGAGNAQLLPIKDNIQPRVGIAWRFWHDTVLRAGYGVYYDTVSARSQYLQNTIEGAAWPWTTGIGTQSANVATGGIWPGATGNPLGFITDIEGNFPSPVVAATPWNGGGYVNDPNYKDTRSQQWNAEIQRQLTHNMMLSVSYVGSHDSRLDYTGYGNSASQPSPKGTPATTIDQLKYVPWAAPTWRFSQSIGWANYNALEAKFERRFSGGLLTLLSYTWSKTLDTSSGYFNAENGSGGSSVVQDYFTPGLNYGPAGYNIPQLLTWSTVYDVPFGRGQKWLTNGPASWVLGNWEANYVFLARSGQPYNLSVSGDIANLSGDNGTISNYGRPNLIGDPNSACTINGATVPSGTEQCFYNPAAFSIPSGSFGTFGKDDLHDEPFFNMDFSLLKNIPITEHKSLQLRFEAFNVFNFQILGTPGTTIGTVSSQGKVTSIASTPRELQLGAKFTF
jgi:Carboxypeptidase regulatory-like domain